MANPNLYVLSYQPGPKWKPGVEIWNQVQGKLRLGGPFTNSSGGMAILRASSSDEAQAVLSQGPAILSGVFIGQTQEWPIIFSDSK